MPQYETFERTKLIKEHLFDVNAKAVEGKDEPQVCAADLVATLRLPAARKDAVANFHDFIFMPIKHAQN